MKRIILPLAISNEIGLRPLTFDILSIGYCSFDRAAPRPIPNPPIIALIGPRRTAQRMIGARALWAFCSTADASVGGVSRSRIYAHIFKTGCERATKTASIELPVSY